MVWGQRRKEHNKNTQLYETSLQPDESKQFGSTPPSMFPKMFLRFQQSRSCGNGSIAMVN